MPDLFIHIGGPKTGTSAIQRHLTRYRGALRKAGTLYPEGGVLKSAHHRLGAAVFAERAGRLGGESRGAVLDEAIGAIRAEMTEHDPKRVIISTEYLWGELPKTDVRSLLDPFAHCALHVVAYLRRQDLFAQSLYMQAVKTGAAQPFAAWLENVADGPRAGLHFDRVLDCWRDCGLPIRLVLRVYEPGQIDADVTRDFMATVCPDIAFQGGDNQGVNTASDVLTIELMRRVNGAMEDSATAHEMRRRLLRSTPPRATFAPISYLSGADAAGFMSRFEEGNRRVATDLLGRADGRLFLQPPPDADAPATTIDDGAMLDRLVALLPQLVGIEHAEPAPDKAATAKEAKRKKRRDRATADPG
ncbi:MAG TPA: hypothetical protein VF636_03990 [Sphingomonas sp.]|jgi:hypothetical protein